MAQQILRMPDVMLKTGLKKSTIHLKIHRGEFPRSVALGPRAVGWLESEIDAWIDGQVRASRPELADAVSA